MDDNVCRNSGGCAAAYRNYYLWDPHSCRLRIC
jgi:hypothetical protein